jgi:cytochrome c oxidase cbb3-type subunit III
MSDETNQIIEGHEYDGIQELDNPLPMWWLITFLGAIIFAFIYSIHVHTDNHYTIHDEYTDNLNKLEAQKQKEPGPEAIDANALLAVSKNPSEIEKGKAHFKTLCVSCHGAEGQGGIGPNLTDEYWIHGRGELTDLATVVQGGVLDKGMPAWGPVLKTEGVFQVVSYVHTLKDTHPAGAKAPQGNKVEE